MNRKYLRHREREKRHFIKLIVAALVSMAVGIGILGDVVSKIQNENWNAVSVIEGGKENNTLKTFEAFANHLFASYVQTDTLTMHYKLADPSAYGIEKKEVTLGEVSGEAFRNHVKDAKENYETLMTFDYETLSREEQITYDVLKTHLEQELKMEGMELYEEVLGEYSGISSQLPVLLSEYEFYTEKDVEDYLELCRQIPSYFAQLIQYEKERLAAGVFMSDSNVDGIIDQCMSFIENPDTNVLIETFSQRIHDFNGTNEAKKTEWIEENNRIVKEIVIPAYKKLMEEMAGLKGKGGAQSLVSLPLGKEYYEAKVQMAVGTEKSVDEIKNMVTQSILEQMEEMQKMCNENPSIAAQASTGSYPAGTWDAMLNDLKNKTTADFPPLQEVYYEINSVHGSLQDHLSPAFYLIPPMDHSWDNVIYINESPQYDHSDLYLTLAHEGFPGHLYQNVYFANQKETPIRYLLAFPGYTEGWATYVENLAYSYMDTMPEDVREYLRLNYFTSLGLYARMDIGVNYDGWTLEQLGELIHTYFNVEDEAMVQDIYDMMTNDPANYLSYYVGGLFFQDLREKAEQSLGDSFSSMKFHEKILEIGPCTFEVLEKYLFDDTEV